MPVASFLTLAAGLCIFVMVASALTSGIGVLVESAVIVGGIVLGLMLLFKFIWRRDAPVA